MTRVPPAIRPRESEAQFQSAVVDLARRCGFRVAHFHDSRRQVHGRLVGDRDAAGWPDLVLCRPPVLLIVELKTDRGAVNTRQLDWLQALHECGARTAVWRPADWPDIQATLAREAA